MLTLLVIDRSRQFAALRDENHRGGQISNNDPRARGNPRHWTEEEDGELIDYVRDRYNWVEIATKMRRSEDSVKGHWYYGNLKSDSRAQGVKYRPLI